MTEREKIPTGPVDILIPLEVPSQNKTDRMHWSTRRKLKAAWKMRILAACRLLRCLREEDRRMKLILTCYRKRLITDRANLVGGAKLVIDAIRDCNLIRDDSDQWAEIEYQQELASKGPANGKVCTRIQVDVA